MRLTVSVNETGELGRQTAFRRRTAVTSRWRAAVYVGSLVFAILWTVALGKDLHWDAINYHLYAGYSALTNRFGLDFFAAGTPAYVNPYAFVPLYLMWQAEWPAMAIAIAHATAHAGVLWLAFELALVAGIRRSERDACSFALLAVVLVALNPVLLQGLGSTMSDLSVAVLVLGGWVAVSRVLRYGAWKMAALAGLLIGAGAALKLSNAVFAIAATGALAFAPGTVGSKFRLVAIYCAACAASFTVVTLPWGVPLWHEFGNPFFPFLNQYFQSPDFTTEALKQERFVPLTWAAFFARPFEMLLPLSAVHVEPRAPDLRYVALLVFGLVWAGLAVLRHRGWCRLNGGITVEDATAGRCLGGLLSGLLISWCLWLLISGNGRYFLPMACVAGVVLALLIQRLHQWWPIATIYATALVILAQIVQLGLGTDLRRDGYEWEGPWFRTEIPARLKEEPWFFISPGFQSGSIFLPLLHPRSGMMNVGGFYVIGPGHPGGARAQRLIQENSERLRLILPLPEGAVRQGLLPTVPKSLQPYFGRLGLRVDATDCEILALEGNNRGERRQMLERWKHFISCRLRLAPDAREAYERNVVVYDLVFDRVEKVCPNLFFPARPITQEFHYWSRTYHSGSEMQLFVDEGRVKYFYYLRGGDPIDIGSLDDWIKEPRPIDCSVRTRPAVINIRH